MRGTILVVDDDRQMAKTLSAVLRVNGWQTLNAYSGEEAVAVVRESELSAVLMDVKMPGMNGVEAFQAIRRLRPTLPVILMTAYSAHELLAEAEREGVLSILPKPIPWPKLTELLDAAVDGRGSLLVVDDDPEFLKTLARVMEERGRPCLQALTLDEALDLLGREAPRIVLLDLRLDHAEPRDAVFAIKQVSPAVILILCSGHSTALDETVAALPEGWVYASLKKPFAPEHLMRILDAVGER